MHQRQFTIQPFAGYQGQVAHIVALLQAVRSTTLKLIGPLNKNDFDRCIPNHNNSIGTLLRHITVMEYNAGCITFLHREMNEKENTKWKDALPGGMETFPVHKKEAGWYINQLKQVRKQTLLQLKPKNIKWLLQYTRLYKNTSNYFMWFHLLEDELCHQGQIKSLLKALK